jgi:hypothetical protein
LAWARLSNPQFGFRSSLGNLKERRFLSRPVFKVTLADDARAIGDAWVSLMILLKFGMKEIRNFSKRRHAN